MATPDQPAMKPSAVGLHTLWRGIRRYPLLVSLAFLLAVGAGACVWLFLPIPKHTGQVVFHVAANPPSVLQTPFDARVDFNLYRFHQMMSLRSKLLLNVAMAEPGMKDLPLFATKESADAVSYLVNNIRVDNALGPEFMRVVLEGDNPDELTVILKSISSAYLKEVVNKDKSRREARIAQLRKLHDTYDANLRSNRRKIREVQEAVGTGDPLAIQIRERFLEAQLGTISGQLAQSVSTQREMKVLTRLLEMGGSDADKGSLPEAVLLDIAKSDPVYVQMQQREKQILASIEASSEVAQPGFESPKVQKLKADLAKLQLDIKQLPEKLKPDIAERWKENSKRTDLQRMEAYKEKMAATSEIQKELEKDVDELIKKKKQLVTGQIDLESLKQEITQSERIAERIVSEIEAIKPELDAPTRVSLWEEPTVGAGVEGNRRLKYTAMAMGGLLIGGLVLASWLEARNRRIQTVDELTTGLGLKVVGTVPRVPRAAAAQEGDQSHWQYLLTESVDTTRTLLLSGCSNGLKPTRVVLVASAQSGEGKTSLACHLSASLARAGLRILLIDADMRRPAVHKVMDLPRTPGLAEVLTKQVTAAEAVRTTRVAGLHVIPAGSWVAEAGAALSGGQLKDLLAEAAAGYDFVMVDSPPILPVSDALAIASKVDGVLVSVMRDVSRFMAVEDACRRLSMVQANIMGVVFAGVETRGYYSYYYDRKYAGPSPTTPGEPIAEATGGAQ